MKLICIFLLLVTLHQTVSFNLMTVNFLYDHKTCPSGTFPRVLSTGTESCVKSQPFDAQCFSCVPEGVDTVCNAQGFLRAYLTSKETPFNCHLSSNENVDEAARVLCPAGSKCVGNPDSVGLGVCCYGNMADGQSTNGDNVCSKCTPACDSATETCQEDVDECGELVYKCKGPRTGINHEGFCSSHADMPKQYCQFDSDCVPWRKCCPEVDSCGKYKVCSIYALA